MKKRTTMLMSALFAAGAFALNGNVAKADNVQAVNNNNANSTEVKQNDENSSYNEIVKENSLTGSLDDVQINWSVSFYPAGSTDFVINGEKQAPSSKNLIVFW